MKNTPVPDNDAERVTALHGYQILDTAPEVAYDEITEILAQVCNCPVATIGLMDENREFYKSKIGIASEICEAPREMNICSHTVCGSDMMVVPDLREDDRFTSYPGVADDPHYRFYCGMPLVNDEGYVLGNICVVDFEPRKLTFQQTEAMRLLARQVMAQLELHRSLNQRDQALRELEASQAELEKQKAQSDQLLHNILPGPVAEELKNNKRVTPRFCDQATILFTDFEGFTKLAERIEPKVLVEQLDQYFSALDEIAERHRLEMLKTIGDSYMCVGGLPEKNRTNVVDACLAALEMQTYMTKANKQREKMRLPRWDLRIGLHTGPVMAGVVGRRKFSYDIWGDAVNIAARMTTNSKPGRVNISGSVFQRVERLFDVEERGSIEVKNKGELEMYFLKEIKTEFTGNDLHTPNDAFHRECEKIFPGYTPTS
jgi:class 3 adenylate cyclase